MTARRQVNSGDSDEFEASEDMGAPPPKQFRKTWQRQRNGRRRAGLGMNGRNKSRTTGGNTCLALDGKTKAGKIDKEES